MTESIDFHRLSISRVDLPSPSGSGKWRRHPTAVLHKYTEIIIKKREASRTENLLSTNYINGERGKVCDNFERRMMSLQIAFHASLRMP